MSEDELLKIDALEEEMKLTVEVGWRSTIVTLLRSGLVKLARDGWTIFPPEHFTIQGFPDRMIFELIKDHKGCSLDGRGGTVRGVYYLDFLYICKFFQFLNLNDKETNLLFYNQHQVYYVFYQL